MKFEATAVEAELRAAFDGKAAALGANDVGGLTAFFWQSPRAVRLMTEGGLYGIKAIAAFRKGRDVSDIARELTASTSWRSPPTSPSLPPNTAAMAPAAAARRATFGSAARKAGASPARMSASEPDRLTPPSPIRPCASPRSR